MAVRTALLLAIAVTVPAVAQQPRSLRLGTSTATHPEEFSDIAGVRELRDGRVIVADAKDTRIVVVDFTTSTAIQIGRVGSGPAEYRDAGRLFAIGGDSSLMVDAEVGRWVVLAGASIVATLPSDHANVRASGMTIVGSDSRGNVVSLGWLPPVALPGGIERTNNVVLRTSRSNSRVDTIITVQGSDTRAVTLGTPPNVSHMVMQVVFSAPDQIAAFPDGWIAIARQDPYRVDWIGPRGERTEGKPFGIAPVRVTAEEKDAFTAAIRRRLGAGAKFPPQMPYASAIAPVRSSGTLPMPDGSILILRSTSRAEPNNRYDVVDRRGVLSATVTLPEQQRIIGFGRDAVYVISTDSDGVQRLQKFPSLQ